MDREWKWNTNIIRVILNIAHQDDLPKVAEEKQSKQTRTLGNGRTR